MRFFSKLFVLWLLACQFVSARPSDFRRVDLYALTAPPSAEKSIDLLARYLAAGAHTDEEQARVIFRWISSRLTYDTKAFLAGNPPQDLGSAFATRKAVCAGYTALYLALAKRMGLQAEQVVGVSKGFGFEAEALTAPSIKHAWIAVRVKGKWILLDPTWASGALGRDGRFQRRFNAYWFDTPPCQLIHDHFPDRVRWQLLEKPWSEERFRTSPRVTSLYFASGLSPVTHQASSFPTHKDVTMRFQGPANLLLTASLLPSGSTPVPPTKESWTFVSRQGAETSVQVRCPGPGNYRLRIYGRKSDGRLRPGQMSYNWLCEYQLHSTCPLRNTGYPQTFSSFAERAVELREPWVSRLVANRQQVFHIIVPGASKVKVVNEGGEQEIDNCGASEFRGEFVPAPGDLTVFALFPGDKRYFGLVKYRVY